MNWRYLCVAVLLTAACAAPIRAPVAERSSVVERQLGGAETYVVEAGDSLFSIAFRYALDYRDLAAWNSIESPFTIHPGEALRLAAPVAVARRALPPGRREAPARPARNTVPAASTSGAGWRWPVDAKPTERFDAGGSGLDFDLPVGTTIRAASRGEVVFVGPGIGNFLHMVIVKVDERYLAAYAVNVPPLVTEGDGVSAGAAIARVDRGRASLRRFHFEVRDQGQPIDPRKLIR